MFNDDGFAEIARSPERAAGYDSDFNRGHEYLGRLMQGDRSYSKRQPSPFSPHWNNRGLTDARFQDSFYTVTDGDGNFEFDRLPPMKGTVTGFVLGHGETLKNDILPSKFQWSLKPGDHKKLTTRAGRDAASIGKVVAKGRDNASLSKQWSITYLVSRRPGMGMPSLAIEPLELTS